MTVSLATRKRLKSASQDFVWLILLEHPEGDIIANTGYRHIEAPVPGNSGIGSGETKLWLGLGLVADIELPEESPAIEVERFRLTLSGVSEKARAVSALRVRGSRLRIWSADLDARRRVVAAELIEDAIADRAGFEAGEDGVNRVFIEANGNFAFLATQAVGRYTPEHQASMLAKEGIDPASDTGFSNQHEIPHKGAAWFRP